MLVSLFTDIRIILETAVGSGLKAQSFELESVNVGGAFTIWECHPLH